MKTPEEQLTAFMASMNEWETKCSELTAEWKAGETSLTKVKQKASALLDPIRQAYVSTQASRRGFSFSTPPEYDPNTESVVGLRSISADRIEVETLQKRISDNHYIYTMVRESGEWKVLKKMRTMLDGTKFDIEI